MRITLVISSMGSGGAERVMSIIANYWADRGEDITLITYYPKNKDFYKLHSHIKRANLGLLYNQSTTVWSAIKNNYTRLSRLRAVIQESHPDVVVSFMDRNNVLTLIATIGLSIPVVVSERTNPKQHSIGPVWNCLRYLFYSTAEALVIQSEAIKGWATGIISSKRLYVIPNPVLPVPKIMNYDTSFSIQSPFIVSMGRLDQYKGFDKLIEAFAQNYKKFPQWSLVILGEGPQRNQLESYAHELGISSRIHFPGQIHEPHATLQQADIYVLSSKYEGFPNALLEAMSCGLAVISFDCPTGPSDIIRNEQDGLLIPPEDVKALIKAIEDLMGDENKRQRLGAQARSVMERFSIEKIIKKWDKVLNEVLN